PSHIVEDIVKPPPHGERERVALVRAVERHGRNARGVDLGQNIIADVLHLADLRTLGIPKHPAHSAARCVLWVSPCPSFGSSANSITRLPVVFGSRNTIRQLPCPIIGFSCSKPIPLARSSAIAASISSTSRQMWKSPSPCWAIHRPVPVSGLSDSSNSR